jgi:hypothetical protein
MGGLGAYLQRIVPDDLRERAFALDATPLQLAAFTFPPALVALTGFLGAPVLAVALMALAAFGALGGTRLLGPQRPSGRIAGASGAWRSPLGASRLLPQCRDGIRRGNDQYRALILTGPARRSLGWSSRNRLRRSSVRGRQL